MNLNPNTFEALKLMRDGILALAKAERQGLRIDIEYSENKKLELTKRIEKLEKEFTQSKFYHHWQHSVKGSININSNPQLRHFLYDIKKLKTDRTTITGQESTDEETLKSFNIPELNTLIQIRRLKKLRDTYLDAFIREQIDGYIHPFYNLHLVRTFRSSSDSPNFQNIPKRDKEAMNICRSAILPRPGHQLVEIDYGQLEVRIAACYNKDQKLIDDILVGDMHRDMAMEIFKLAKYNKQDPGHVTLRQAAKNGFVFPQFYGDYYKNCVVNICEWGKLPQTRWKEGQGIKIGDQCLSDHLIRKGIKSFDSFTEHIKKIEADFWGRRYNAYQQWKDDWWEAYQEKGYFDTLTNFRCNGLMKKNDAINYPVQGSAFHCLLWSFIELDRRSTQEKWDTKLVGQIHDAIVLDVNPKELNKVIEIAREVTCKSLTKVWDWIIVPLEIDIEISPIDASWACKEKISK